MPWPRKTSTCRRFVTISSGLCRLFAIVVLLHGQNHTSRWTRSMGVDHSSRGMFGHGRVLPPELRTIEGASEISRLLLIKAARRLRRENFYAAGLWLWLSI